uniref:RxLR effector protein n=1 Tax=Phytophthora agathidicida TaxID=1642459 RepID=A0A7G4WI61_9STRA|nr:PaRXLR72 [Phytophthora agathidicida]
MRLHHFLFVTLAILLASTGALTKPTKRLSDDPVVPGRNEGRSLRITNVPEKDDNDDVKEERANFISSTISKISSKIPIGAKLSWWQQWHKDEEFIKMKLGMQGLKGEALTKHHNYPRLVGYLETAEKNWMRKRARQGLSTYSIWKSKGLDAKITSLAQLQASLKSEKFQFYKRYVVAFDDNVDTLSHSGYYQLSRLVDEDATEMEMLARAQVWGETKRPIHHVQEILGLGVYEKDTAILLKNRFFNHYWEVRYNLPITYVPPTRPRS